MNQSLSQTSQIIQPTRNLPDAKPLSQLSQVPTQKPAPSPITPKTMSQMSQRSQTHLHLHPFPKTGVSSVANPSQSFQKPSRTSITSHVPSPKHRSMTKNQFGSTK